MPSPPECVDSSPGALPADSTPTPADAIPPLAPVHTIRIDVNAQKEDTATTVRVEIPVAVVDARLSGESDTLNGRAALLELSTHRGELVRVIGLDTNIRVWVDEIRRRDWSQALRRA